MVALYFALTINLFKIKLLNRFAFIDDDLFHNIIMITYSEGNVGTEEKEV